MKLWLHDNDNDVKICSTHNEGCFVIVERMISTLMNKVYKYMAAVSKNVYIKEKENWIPVNVKSGTYTDFGVDDNDKDPKFKVGDNVRKSKY